MIRTPAYVSCLAVLLSACSAGSSFDFSDVQAAVAQAQVDQSLPAEKPVPQSIAEDKNPEQKEWLEISAIRPVVLNAPSYMMPYLTPRYATLWLSCVGDRQIHAIVHDSDIAPTTNENGDILVHQKGEFIGDYRTFWQRNSVLFDETLTAFPPLFEKITKQVPDGNGGILTRTEHRLNSVSQPIGDVLLPNLKAAKTMRLVNTNGRGPTFDLTNIKSDIERLEAECTPKDAANAK